METTSGKETIIVLRRLIAYSGFARRFPDDVARETSSQGRFKQIQKGSPLRYIVKQHQYMLRARFVP